MISTSTDYSEVHEKEWQDIKAYILDGGELPPFHETQEDFDFEKLREEVQEALDDSEGDQNTLAHSRFTLLYGLFRSARHAYAGRKQLRSLGMRVNADGMMRQAIMFHQPE
jgi:hypothetical protein